MKNKLILFILFGIFMISLVNASLGIFKQNECINIKTILNSTSVNISTINYPNSTLAISNQVMSKIGQTFNYTFCNTSTLGIYIYDYFDNLGNVYVNDFTITYTGKELTSEQTYIYIVSLIILIILILGISFIINKLPSRDSVNDKGLIIDINKLKYLRNFFWIIIWGLCMAIIFIISNLAIAYIQDNMIGKFFFVIYQIMFWTTIIGVPIYFIFIFVKIYQDAEMQKLINRGVDIRGTP